jgi:replicative DNA helicase
LETGIPSQKISSGKLDETEWIQLTNKIGSLNSANLIIDDTPALSVFDLRAKCRRLKHQRDIKLIIVDYLQLMRGGSETEKNKGNREQEISYISRSLKTLAKDLDVPVIALSQLSREVEKRSVGFKRPQLSDLRESGSIEQDADLVIFIYRPEAYGFHTFEDETTPAAGLADIMIQKNRHGATDNIRVRFQSQYTRFSDIDSTYSFDSPTAGIENNQNFDYISSSMNDDFYEDRSASDNTIAEDYPY